MDGRDPTISRIAAEIPPARAESLSIHGSSSSGSSDADGGAATMAAILQSSGSAPMKMNAEEFRTTTG